MKTAMAEMIEWLQAYEYEIPLELHIKAKELLEKEKEQIINAHNEGIWHTEKCFDEGEEYYNNNYGK